jgi:EAL domain-containing protein (putative c-di-GMP-specific phosphodiesterase class I)/AmiR/NasT family two-component response regulator
MNLSTLRVMVVEDHDFQRRTALQMLRSLGVVELYEASDGMKALEVIAGMAGKPDVIISDLDMPGMDGIEFIRHIAEQRLAYAVAISSSLDQAMLNTVEAMARAYGLQVMGTVEKPLTARRLTQILALYQKHANDSESAEPSNRPDLTGEVLRQALENNEFVPFYQPKIDLRTGECKGAESLVRWRRPGGDLVSPAFFLPAIEKERLLDELTERMLIEACRAQKDWEGSSLRLGVSLNVSMLSLGDVGIADRYLRLVQSAAVDPRLITFEVTETAVMQDPARALNILARLRLKGFGLSIDDFGTGYSSLQQLGAIPFTELKVDQSFVHGSVEDARKRTMVETSLELAKKLKLKTVAEGAETRAEWDLLIALGCDQVQGYFVAKPMPGDQIPGWTRAWKPPVSERAPSLRGRSS